MQENCLYRISAKALIYNDAGEILLCKEECGKWSFPWWGVRQWEKIEASIKRELMEEMWLEVAEFFPKIKFMQLCEFLRDPYYKADAFYEVKVKDLNFTPSNECVEIWFFNSETVKNVPTFNMVCESILELESLS